MSSSPTRIGLLATVLVSVSLALSACSVMTPTAPDGPAPSTPAATPAAAAPAASAAPTPESGATPRDPGVASPEPTSSSGLSDSSADAAGTSPLPAPGDDDAEGLYGYYYGAISLATRSTAVGYAYNYSSASRALAAAQSRCRNVRGGASCASIVWVRNGCAAVSARYYSNGRLARYGWAVRSTKASAVSAAQKSCGSNCRTRAWVCTSR